MPFNMDEVVVATCDVCKVTEAGILSASRTADLVEARAVLVFCIIHLVRPEPSYPEIAERLQRKIHSSVWSMYDRAIRDHDPKWLYNMLGRIANQIAENREFVKTHRDKVVVMTTDGGRGDGFRVGHTKMGGVETG